MTEGQELVTFAVNTTAAVLLAVICCQLYAINENLKKNKGKPKEKENDE